MSPPKPTPPNHDSKSDFIEDAKAVLDNLEDIKSYIRATIAYAEGQDKIIDTRPESPDRPAPANQAPRYGGLKRTGAFKRKWTRNLQGEEEVVPEQGIERAFSADGQTDSEVGIDRPLRIPLNQQPRTDKGRMERAPEVRKTRNSQRRGAAAPAQAVKNVTGSVRRTTPAVLIPEDLTSDRLAEGPALVVPPQASAAHAKGRTTRSGASMKRGHAESTANPEEETLKTKKRKST